MNGLGLKMPGVPGPEIVRMAPGGILPAVKSL